MLRILISVLILVLILMFAFTFAKSNLFNRTENTTTVIELGRTVSDVREMKNERDISIKENEKLVEDLNEEN